jgi:hypothetical protein
MKALLVNHNEFHVLTPHYNGINLLAAICPRDGTKNLIL